MLCGNCGAINSPSIDRCYACSTPFPPGMPSTPAPLGSDITRLDSGIENSPRTTPLPAVSALEPGQTFAGRYNIIRLLGSGGMAAVYQAWDETLSTAVALKLIRVDAGMPAFELKQLEDRFKRELKLARQVTHPNVIRIHDLGEVGNTLYLTMAYVQGGDLAALLRREGRLTLPRALALARQIASGLAAAHAAGVVHRDLKPANIMVDSEDRAFVTDFGIARSTSASTLHTLPGSILGTLDYMSPEQARGEPAGEASDVYAFGLILYELLAGGRPRATSGGGGLSDLIARLEQGPPPLRTVLPEVPAGLERIVTKCLNPDRTARYPTGAELLADLEALEPDGRQRVKVLRPGSQWKPLLAAVMIAGLLVASTWWVASRRAPPAPTAPRAPVSVLIADFDNRARDPVFEGSLEQALSIAIEGAPFITAYPRRDAAALAKQVRPDATLNEEAARLVAYREGIRIILAGSVERVGDGYRLVVRTIDPDRSEPVASATVTASDKSQVLVAVGRIAERVRTALGDTTPSAQQQAETFTAGSLEAVRAYTIAQELSSNQKDAEAIVHYNEAIKHDPEFGRAYSGLANSLRDLGRRDEAEKYWKEALKRMDRMSEREKLRTLGGYYLAVAQNSDEAIQNYEQLVTKYPADSAGHNNLAVAYFSRLNFAKALDEGQKAISIYPKIFKYRLNYALYAMYASDFKSASAIAQALVQEDPTFEQAYLPLAMVALAGGDDAGARAAYDKAGQTGEEGASLASGGLADLAIYEGRYDDAIAMLPAAIARDRAQQNTFAAAAKLLALAEAQAALGHAAAASKAIADARALGEDDNVLVTAARLAIAGGRQDEARAIVEVLAKKLSANSRAYAKLIDAERALTVKQYTEAIDALRAARTLADLWLVRYALGQAYFQRGNFAEAVSEFALCQKRRGEATAIFLDDLPTYRYYATVPYWLARSQEAIGMNARPGYEEFLKIRGHATNDPLVQDTRQRLSALGKLR